MIYKFENYKDPTFPIYSSQQKGEGQLVVPHYHSAFEFLRIIDGCGEMLIGTKKFKISKGDIIFIPQNAFHSLHSESVATKTQSFTFDKSIFGEDILPENINDILSEVNIENYIYASDKNDNMIFYFDRLSEYYTQDFATKKLKTLSSLCKIMSLVIEHYSENIELKTDYARIKPVIKYIQQNFRQKIKLSQLSEILCVCDDHLIRLFKTYTHKSPVRFINDIRIENAMRLLAQTDLSISEIAFSVGFSSPNYMCKTFREAISMTPGEYRKTKNGL